MRSELLPAEYAAVADLQRERAESFAQIAAVPGVYEDGRELMNVPGLTAVYICAQTSQHPALVEAASARGLDIFCEKPLARNLPEARRMVEAVEAAGVRTQVGLVLRRSPILNVLADLMADPGLGPLMTAHLRDDQFFPVRGHYNSTWRGDVREAGGGTLIEHSIHDIDLFRWFFGEIERVRCHTRYVSGREGVEDVALATFQHSAGHVTTLSSVWHEMDGRPSTRRLEVFFQNGWFAIDDDFLGPIQYQGKDGDVTTIEAHEVMARYADVRGLSDDERVLAERGMEADYRFLEALNRGEAPFPDFRVALRAHEVVDACYRSASLGEEVTVASEP